ncbi:MAG: metal-dependent transcriptional regulator [Verrucomicrobiota bacterium]|nr:metal-dependent transcriptional regulator [Verrucomicrobiota bacterium]
MCSKNINNKKTYPNDLTPSMEDYMECIGVLVEKADKQARVTDIATHLGVSRPSVCAALNNLSDKGYILHEHYGGVKLTKSGEIASIQIRKRHEILYTFLVDILHLDNKTAEKEACLMEHSISSLTLRRLNNFLEIIEDAYDNGKADWLRAVDR